MYPTSDKILPTERVYLERLLREPVNVKLSLDESLYLQKLLREHVEYYRTLAGHSNTSEATLIKLRFLESLFEKLGRND